MNLVAIGRGPLVREKRSVRKAVDVPVACRTGKILYKVWISGMAENRFLFFDSSGEKIGFRLDAAGRFC
ncbi:MAG: hypothetical protein ABSG28_09975 [Methanoregula sp.]|jgi:hypothetical protein